MSTLVNIAAIYKLFLRTGNDLTVTTLVNELGMAKSSASRLLKQMSEHGLLERDKARPTYRPSMLIMELSHQVRQANPMIDMLLDSMTELCAATGFTCYVSEIDRDEIRVFHAQTGTYTLSVVTEPGTRLPVATTSTGRALLTRAKPEVLQNFMPINPVHRERLMQELDKISKQGWAASINEHIADVASISAAIHDPARGKSLALCLSLPIARIEHDTIQQLSAMVCEHASRIGRMVGDPYWRAKQAELQAG